jgi:hypothetical protein
VLSYISLSHICTKHFENTDEYNIDFVFVVEPLLVSSVKHKLRNGCR